MQDFEIDWNLVPSDPSVPPVDTMDVPNDAPSAFLASKGYLEPMPPATILLSSFSAPVVQESAAVLVQSERSVLREHGIAESEQWFADGTAFMQSGHDKLESDIAAIMALPDLDGALGGLKATIAAERRVDRIVDLRTVRIDSEGNLNAAENPDITRGVVLEPNAWRQLAALAGSQNVNAGLRARTVATMWRVRTRILPR